MSLGMFGTAAVDVDDVGIGGAMAEASTPSLAARDSREIGSEIARVVSEVERLKLVLRFFPPNGDFPFFLPGFRPRLTPRPLPVGEHPEPRGSSSESEAAFLFGTVPVKIIILKYRKISSEIRKIHHKFGKKDQFLISSFSFVFFLNSYHWQPSPSSLLRWECPTRPSRTRG